MTSEPASRPAKDGEIWIICGNACAGKTTTARLLAQRLPPAAHVDGDGDEMQRLIASGCRWPVPSDSDPGTGRLTGEAGVQYALRIRNACLVAAAFADAGITAIVTDSIINEGFESLTEVLGGQPVNFVVLRPPVAVLRQRGIGRLPEEAAYLADRYGDSGHPEAAAFAARVQAAADGRPVNEFEGSSSGASIACRTLGSGLTPVASIRKVWWIFCWTAGPKPAGWQVPDPNRGN
jgi:chloramphenicol 3-O-phosphotransferase